MSKKSNISRKRKNFFLSLLKLSTHSISFPIERKENKTHLNIGRWRTSFSLLIRFGIFTIGILFHVSWRQWWESQLHVTRDRVYFTCNGKTRTPNKWRKKPANHFKQPLYLWIFTLTSCHYMYFFLFCSLRYAHALNRNPRFSMETSKLQFSIFEFDRILPFSLRSFCVCIVRQCFFFFSFSWRYRSFSIFLFILRSIKWCREKCIFVELKNRRPNINCCFRVEKRIKQK